MRNWNVSMQSLIDASKHVFTVPMRNWNNFFYSIEYAVFLCFYSTYEELKQPPWAEMEQVPAEFLQYLWGIETWHLLYLLIGVIAFLQYLWGIETATPTYWWHNVGEFLQYLWGIETCIWKWMINLIHNVFTVPMRNWNFTTPWQMSSVSSRFYSTYEELKHGKVVDKNSLVTSFYSTYEELKLMLRLRIWLKPPRVFTVPMRNWNIATQLYAAPSGDRFLQYLWGIETSSLKSINDAIP